MIKNISDIPPRKPFFSRLAEDLPRILSDLVLLALIYVIITHVSLNTFSWDEPVPVIASLILFAGILYFALIIRNAVYYRTWSLWPVQKNQENITPGTLKVPRQLTMQERMGRIAGVSARLFFFLLVISVFFGLHNLALAAPLTFTIFFWIFIAEITGLVLCYLAWIRLVEGKWGIIPGSINQALGKEGRPFVRLLLFWNGLCFLWIFVNLFFLYSGTPRIDSDTYGMGLGVIVGGNGVIGLLLGISKYGSD